MFDTHVDLTPVVMIVMTALVIPLIQFACHTAVAVVGKKLEPYLGPQRDLAIQQHANELFDKAIGDAALHYLPELQAHGLTVDVGNALAAHAVGYFVSNAPDLADRVKSYEGSLEDMARARLLAHPAVAASGALGVAQPMPAAA